MNNTILKFSLGLFALCSAGHMSAETATGNASVTVLQTIAFAEGQPIAFGAISDANGSCTMDSGGVLAGTCAGQPNGTPGQFTVIGTANQSINVSVGSGSSMDGVTLTPTLNSGGSTALNSAGEAIIDVSGELALSSATGGFKALSYVLTVNYN